MFGSRVHLDIDKTVCTMLPPIPNVDPISMFDPIPMVGFVPMMGPFPW